MLKDRINNDLKAAMLAGDKNRVTVLRGLKSVILYAEVAQGVRDKGLPEEELIALLAKEVKKRQESAALYEQGGDQGRKDAELVEKAIIEEYLPQQLSDEELAKIVDEAIAQMGSGPQAMGKIIGMVKQKPAGQADGARIASLVKERLK